MSIYNVEIDKYGNKYYYVNKTLHREDRSAIEYADGSKYWYKNGLLHRENGPAVDCTDGFKSWYKNGELHREDGPAIEWDAGAKNWYLNNKEYGVNDDFTNKSWKKFIKTLIFL